MWSRLVDQIQAKGIRHSRDRYHRHQPPKVTGSYDVVECTISTGKATKKKRWSGHILLNQYGRHTAGGLQWLGENKYHGLLQEGLSPEDIEVVFHWEFREEPMSSTPSSDDDGSQGRRKKDNKRKRSEPTASQRQRKSTAFDRQIADATGDYCIDIIDLHRCASARYKNLSKTCVLIEGGEHISIHFNTVKRWA